MRSLVVHSQDVHRIYGGVVPELAARDHLMRIEPVVAAALNEAGIERRDLGAIAVAAGPGLIGALLVGVTWSRASALALGIPMIPVHHMEGHIFGPVLEDPGAKPPFVALLVSGGHTLLIWVPEWGSYHLMGETRGRCRRRGIRQGGQAPRPAVPGWARRVRGRQIRGSAPVHVPAPHAEIGRGPSRRVRRGRSRRLRLLLLGAEDRGRAHRDARGAGRHDRRGATASGCVLPGGRRRRTCRQGARSHGGRALPPRAAGRGSRRQPPVEDPDPRRSGTAGAPVCRVPAAIDGQRSDDRARRSLSVAGGGRKGTGGSNGQSPHPRHGPLAAREASGSRGPKPLPGSPPGRDSQ